uniref:Uncharacterized protein n=1 Tax=Trypanosoma vivax (strain Y486) TaxID=1055687 RepID=G0TRF5_TRYVY|nr:conserved hypothetical protein [Trypanosoma vivax Y486]
MGFVQRKQANRSGVKDNEMTGFAVQPFHVIFGTAAFVVCVILLHFYGKLTS